MWRVLLQQLFRIWHSTETKKTSIAKVDAFVAALETCFSNNEINRSEAAMKLFMTHADELMNDFDKQYFDKHISNPTFAFWNSALILYQHYLYLST